MLKTILQKKELKSTLRVAGGWVRDKLLGLESHDIDIAIDDMTGEQFVHIVDDYMGTMGQQLRGHGVVKLNPEKSKHLETACCKIQGFDIDFVNLRGEHYSESSRIPQITFGTPKQDAERRDLTINALFYNINSEAIEDFTEMGLQDLQNQIIRTPLPPLTTFTDDPLRVLRVIRFASRFNFKIVDEIVQAYRDPSVKEALIQKVSKERVREEVVKIINHKHMPIGMKYLFDYNFWDIVFCIPPVLQEVCKDEKLQAELHKKSFQLLMEMGNHHDKFAHQVVQKYKPMEQVRFYSLLSSALLPYQPYQFKQGKNTIGLVQYITQQYLKFSNAEQQNVGGILQGVAQVQKIVAAPLQDPFLPVVKLIKDQQDNWELAYYVSLVHDTLFDKAPLPQYPLLMQYINKLNLQEIFALKPLLNGNEIVQLFNLQKAGPIIKNIKNNIFVWQVQNQQLTAEDLIKEIKQDQTKFTKENNL